MIPLYLPGFSLSSFLKILTIKPSLHCLGTISSCQITENNCSSKSTIPDLPYLSNSSTIPSLPLVLLFLSFLTHFAILPFSISFSKKASPASPSLKRHPQLPLTSCYNYLHYPQSRPSSLYQTHYPHSSYLKADNAFAAPPIYL